jgi:hypothetical protein
MILWTDFVALGLLALVLLGLRLVVPRQELPPQVARLVRALEVLMVLLLVAMVLLVRGQ